MTRAERVSRNLNRALHALFAADERAWLLGEDVADPYGGAFKVTQGLSTAYPDRVLSTPLSENGITGVAGGLALCGDTVIVEIMFGDFAGLAFDPILNLITKSVAMYGERTPMRVVIRCPVGGGRGYGATHSQSPQKHFIGIPHLALYELSPLHDAADVLAAALRRDEPAMLFEDKILYTRRRYVDGRVDDRLAFELRGADGNWARVHDPDATGAPTLVIAPGGVADRAIAAATRAAERGRPVEVLVPARLYPVDVDGLRDLLDGAHGVIVAEESTAGGTWGSEVAARLHAEAWPLLRGPVELVSSADRVIPSAPHLEQAVLLGTDAILDRIMRLPAPRTAAGDRGGRTVAGPAAPAGVSPGVPVDVPRLNPNDDSYVLLEWLVADGATVEAGEPVAAVETSKAIEELAATQAGVLRQDVAAGADCAPGTPIGRILPEPAVPAPVEPPGAPAAAYPEPVEAVGTRTVPPGRPLPPAQRRIADVVSTSHREIPVAFTAVRVDVTAALAYARRAADETGASVGLTEVVIAAVAALHERFSGLYARLTGDGLVVDAEAPSIGLTVDVGTGLFLPVIRDAAGLDLGDLADAVVALRMKALRGRLREEDMAGMNFLVALNDTPGVTVARPVVPPGVTCALSVPDVHREVVLDGDGGVRERTVADLGLAYDHRLVNGAQAGAYLAALAEVLQR
ncbi:MULTISPECIES: 2-oxo acid dehydrogenase subunit E2 [unclassified Micromonospora]|uniref:2-oxo acid dehydrogenase subunit E2 n=1 Tax=unclassified Micromonospora TaxID=2617518 RepID=UPI0022B7394F|nr:MULTISPECIES: 2-oxo acid dehydrogenase subunit E2 [unclassified Micromonospora]MCZ7474839.1 2-oxo acid dehydrogenase subunit E2 [Micromonospora sp. WMMC273]WBC05464.1 2-oxo acid dehydrogenase subunit E2 [Micromonospora sp. WMMA1976]